MKAKWASVVIPNFNGKDCLNICLDSLRRQSYRRFEIIVVDNGSTDGSIRFLQENYPEVEIISLDNNYGFARAANQGITKAKGDYIVLLNNDVEVEEGWLEQLIRYLDSHEQVSACGSLMLNYFERNKIDSMGIKTYWDLDGGDRNMGKDLNKVNLRTEEILGPCAGAAIYRKEVFDRIGLFNEKFESYKEDLDFSLRMRKKGYRSVLVASAVVYHMRSLTSKRIKLKAIHRGVRNYLFFVRGNFSKFTLGILGIFILTRLIWMLVVALKHHVFGDWLEGLKEGMREKVSGQKISGWYHEFRLLSPGLRTGVEAWDFLKRMGRKLG